MVLHEAPRFTFTRCCVRSASPYSTSKLQGITHRSPHPEAPPEHHPGANADSAQAGPSRTLCKQECWHYQHGLAWPCSAGNWSQGTPHDCTHVHTSICGLILGGRSTTSSFISPILASHLHRHQHGLQSKSASATVPSAFVLFWWTTTQRTHHTVSPPHREPRQVL